MATTLKTTQSTASPVSFTYLLKETVLIVSFLYLFIFNGSSQDFTTQPVQIMTAALVTTVAAAWLLSGQAAPTPLGRSLLAFTAAYLLAAVFSVDPRRSVEDFGWLVFMVFLFALTADLAARRWPAELIIKTLLVAWSVVLLFSWIAPVMWYLDWLRAFPGRWLPDVVYRPPMPNTLAMSVNTFLMIAIGRWFYTRSLAGRVALGGVIAAALAMMYLTSSRAGWMGTAAGFACLGLWLVRKQGPRLLSAWQWIRLRPAVLAAGGLALTAGLVVIGVLLYRQSIHPTHGPLLSSRYQFWNPAISTFLQHPIVGQGPNTMSRSILQAKTLPPGMVFVHAHSTPLNLLAETGLVGLLCALGVGAGLVLAFRRRWQEAQGSDLAVVMGASGALAAYTVHSMFDSFQTEPVGLWLLVIVLGAALGGGRSTQQGHSGGVSLSAWKKILARPWWAAALAGGLWLNLWLMQPLAQGVDAMNSNRPQEAAVLLEQAVVRDPHSMAAWQQLGLARAAVAQDEAGYRKAIQALERAAEMDPAWGFNYGNIGALYSAAGDLDTARRWMEKSFVLADVPVFHLNLAIIAEKQGDLETARREYTLALEKYNGGWEGDFWQRSPLLMEIREERMKPDGLTHAEVSALEAALAADSSTLPKYLALAQAYWDSGRVEEAGSLLQKARFTPVLEGRYKLHLERLSIQVAEAQGRTGDADQYRQALALDCQMQGFVGPSENITLHYLAVAFRKPAIYIEMVPQLERLPCP